MIRRHRTPHSTTFAMWVRKHYGRPYDPRIIFQKYDQEIWSLVRPVEDQPTDVIEFYSRMIERASARVVNAARVGFEAY